MDLLCREQVCSSGSSTELGASPPQGGVVDLAGHQRCTRRALSDPVLKQDRVFLNMLKAEERHLPIASYFGTVQDEITSNMRKIVAEWMLEVCEERGCQEEVFTLAMSYLDRFLSTCCIRRGSLQLLGSACLLLASKLREPSSKGLPAEVLVFYTDNSITLQELCKWELLVLSKLKWDMGTVTPQDFLEPLVDRLPLADIVRRDMVIRHAQTFISLAAKEYQFTRYTSSTVAAACVVAALQGLEWGTRANVPLAELLLTLHNLTGIEQDYLQTCLEQIEQMVKKTIEERSLDAPNDRAATGSEMGAGMGAENTGAQATAGAAPQGWSPRSDKLSITSGTPTDLLDINF